ncbi:hypothetical protein [Anaerosinus massiliensis]|uniref:hypothetical protein n=1 Tax=Massilibacillus massiliensis TaxID=1806837 RepID=UPI000AF8194C|nr:hypothetical protein [Massilibacillus massiliensis]
MKLTDEERIEEEKRRIDSINKEKRRLNSIFTKIDVKAKKAVQSLIENAAFMAVTLQDLQRDINEKGAVSEYKNGENQWGTKKSPEVEIYNTMVKNHAAIIKQLTELLPRKDPKPEDDGFETFVNNR